jgi:hypothetical protein
VFNVVFVFNVPSWTCLFVYVDKNWAVFGTFFQSLLVLCGAFGYNFVEGGGGGVLGVLIGESEKEHIVILCWEHIGNQRKIKRNSPLNPTLPQAPPPKI